MKYCLHFVWAILLVSCFIVGGVLAVTAGVIAIYNVFSPEEPQWFSIVQFMEYNATQINELGCQYLAVDQLSHQQ